MGAPITVRDENTIVQLKVRAAFFAKEWILPMLLGALLAFTLVYLIIQVNSLKTFTGQEYVIRYSIDVQDPVFRGQIMRLDLNFKDSTFAAESTMMVYATLTPKDMGIHKDIGSYQVTLVGSSCTTKQFSDFDRVDDCEMWLDVHDNTYYREARYVTYYQGGMYPVMISSSGQTPVQVKTDAFVKVNYLEALQTFELSRITNNIGLVVSMSNLLLAGGALVLAIKYRKR